MRRNFRRVAVQPQAQEQYIPASLVAPILGWRASDNIAAMPPNSAYQLLNWFPTQTGIRARRGAKRHARIHATDPVTSGFNYVSGNVKKMFFATAAKIFDVTTVADDDVPPSAAVSGQSAGYYSTAQLSNDSGDYLYAVNGVDDPQLYNGSTWQAMNGASTPTLTGATGLEYVWGYRNRVFFLKRNAMRFYYLTEVNAIGGALASFPLTGVAKKGGYVLFGGTWSLVDVGVGMDDRCFLVTTEGELIVYEGNDPGTADAWNLVGVYDIPPPLGPKCWWQVGTDIQIGTVGGMVSMKMAIGADEIQLSIQSVSAAIDLDWEREAGRRKQLPWEMMKWAENSMGLVSLPSFSTEIPSCYAVNLKTGAWTKFIGWDTRCMALHNNQVYFGTRDGRILQADIGGYDDGELYTCTAVFAFGDFGLPGRYKSLHLARGVFLASHAYNAVISASGDYIVELPTAPNAVNIPGLSGVFDTAKWDVDVFDQASAPRSAVSEWQSPGISGFSIAMQVQITIGSTPSPDIELVKLDVLFAPGEIPV